MPALVARRPWAAVVSLMVMGALAGILVNPPVARAAGTHRALVVVDTGSKVVRHCVGFSNDTITGKQALDQADVQPVYAGYSSMGSAVCSLCGTGCPSDNCFCDPDHYWRYYRQPAGSSVVTSSSSGASSTQVHDGDVEHWKWFKNGDATPPPDNIDTYCAPSAQPAAAAPPTTAGSTGKATSGVSPAPRTTATGGSAATTASSTEPDGAASVTTTTDGGTLGPAAAGPRAPTRSSPAAHHRSGTSGAGIVAFLLAITALVAATLLARRRRNARSAS